MVRIEESGLLQEAAYWAFAAPDRHGQPRVRSPIEILTRWEKSRRESIGDDAAPIATDAQIMVDRNIAEGSLMRWGTLASVPTPPDSLYEVVAYDEVPDIKSREIQRNVTLRRWKQTMAEIV